MVWRGACHMYAYMHAYVRPSVRDFKREVPSVMELRSLRLQEDLSFSSFSFPSFFVYLFTSSLSPLFKDD